MKRITLPERENWRQEVESHGFTYHTAGKTPEEAEGTYWYEQAAYEFTADEVDQLEAASEILHQLCLAAVDYAVKHPEELEAFGIDPAFHGMIKRSWAMYEPYWMGRFDLVLQPDGQIKLLEYNADTPTLVIETSLVQWFWLQATRPKMDQFNSLHEKLLDRIKWIGEKIPIMDTLYFAGCMGLEEEAQHITYFLDLARQAGINAVPIDITDIGYNQRDGFVDLSGNPIRFMHKLYPWEWMTRETFGRFFPHARMGILEPPWKMLLSNKALLPLLWRLFPNHPNLLAASFNQADVGPRFIAKPILGREGANMTISRDGQAITSTGGSYGSERRVYQALADVPVHDGQHVILGSWMVGQRAAGIIVRESENPIVVNTSRVVPHYFVPRTGETG